MNIVFGTQDDIDSWMELVNDVSRNFPVLETYERIEEHNGVTKSKAFDT